MADVLPWVSVIVVLAGVVANYAVTNHRVNAVEKQLAAILGKLDGYASHSFSLVAQQKAQELFDVEMRGARTKLHNLDTALQKAVLLLHLMRRGVAVPESAVEAVTAHMNADEATSPIAGHEER